MKRTISVLLVAAVCMFAVVSVSAQPAASEKTDPVVFQSVQDLGPYRIAKYDILDVSIIGYPDEPWMRQITVGPDGFINLPYSGMVKVGGLTVDEATAVLKEKLSEYIIIPQLAVAIRQYGARQVYVMGEVNREGIYTLTSDKMNVFAALSSAGGIEPKGRPKHISVVRVADNKVYVKEVNFDAFVKKQDVSQNVWLQDGDMIYVPKSGKVMLTQDILPMLTTWAIVRDTADN